MFGGLNEITSVKYPGRDVSPDFVGVFFLAPSPSLIDNHWPPQPYATHERMTEVWFPFGELLP